MRISAIVVGKNEGNKLKTCLKSLHFCDEILYGDLNSTDNSIAIANEFNCKIFNYETYGPSCEYTQVDLIKKVKNDWVIMLDPDEALTESLVIDINNLLPQISLNENIGDIYVPWQFYFGKIMLKGTVWGYEKEKGILVNRHKYEILPITHYGRKLKKGFNSYHISNNGTNVLNHYWMDNIKSFIDKHKKYLKDEGRDRYNNGQRISILGIIYNIFYQFYLCFFVTKGYKNGLTGFFLSLFWTWYITSSNISLFLTDLKKSNGKS
jgi:hypothetical protein